MDATCVATETAADQCAVTNSECRNDGAGSKCLCKTSHYKDGTGCVISKTCNINMLLNLLILREFKRTNQNVFVFVLQRGAHMNCCTEQILEHRLLKNSY